MRRRAFCRFCGQVIGAKHRACNRHSYLLAHDSAPDQYLSTRSTDLSTPQAAPRREAMAPQIGADPA